MYRFTAPNTWANEGAFTALMQWIPAPAGFPSSGDYLEGTVKNAANVVVGRLKMDGSPNICAKPPSRSIV